MNTHDKLHKLFSNGIRVCPVHKGSKFAVCVEDDFNAVYKRNKTVGEYKHTNKSFQEAQLEAIDYICNKLNGIRIDTNK
jgi:hypothetical protein